MGRFASTVATYESARPPYGEAFFSAVARRLAFKRRTRLLDVGTGPGLLAIGFAPFCGANGSSRPKAIVRAVGHTGRHWP